MEKSNRTGQENPYIIHPNERNGDAGRDSHIVYIITTLSRRISMSRGTVRRPLGYTEPSDMRSKNRLQELVRISEQAEGEELLF